MSKISNLLMNNNYLIELQYELNIDNKDEKLLYFIISIFMLNNNSRIIQYKFMKWCKQ